jgi:hypothetical protein
MKERPMMFTGATVQAILDGRKTQTRRIVSPQPIRQHHLGRLANWPFPGEYGLVEMTNYATVVRNIECPHGIPKDRLWIKETWAETYKTKNTTAYVYRADNPQVKIERWKSAMFMPRRASRINLEITDVHVERLQDISDADAKAEGIYLQSSHGLYNADHTKMWGGRTPVEGYRALWDSLNSKRGFGWDKNPWVWKITFKRV